MASTIHQHGQGDNVAGDKVMGNKVTYHNQGANIGNLVSEAKGNAQVTASSFSQTSGTSTAELLDIIANLRQLAVDFPPAIQEDLIIDIEDVEAEIQKPESDRSHPRLKKRLMALLMAVSTMAGGVAGSVAAANEFADNVIDLGSKVGIELQLPPSPQN